MLGISHATQKLVLLRNTFLKCINVGSLGSAIRKIHLLDSGIPLLIFRVLIKMSTHDSNGPQVVFGTNSKLFLHFFGI